MVPEILLREQFARLPEDQKLGQAGRLPRNSIDSGYHPTEGRGVQGQRIQGW